MMMMMVVVAVMVMVVEMVLASVTVAYFRAYLLASFISARESTLWSFAVDPPRAGVGPVCIFVGIGRAGVVLHLCRR